MKGVFDAIVIGGGFYGAAIAIYLRQQRGLRRVLLVERESEILQRASYNNQARVHNGYHYPRSFTTAFRSRINLPNFIKLWPSCVYKDFVQLYAIARRNSKVTARQFERFCRDIEAPLRVAGASYRALFDPKLVEGVYVVEEHAFDAGILAQQLKKDLESSQVEVRLATRALTINKSENGRIFCTLAAGDDASQLSEVSAPIIMNCTYSGLNQLTGDFRPLRTPIKQEITEMALIEPPAPLLGIGITMMDGPFFSMMPFPARSLYSLSHVRYTPHMSWLDQAGHDPNMKLMNYKRQSRFDRMIRDASRFVPLLSAAKYRDSLFEVKTVLVKNESDDGRPILLERQENLPGCYSILGGKIDNIFDIFEKLDAEDFTPLHTR
ncbi:MAG: D amino acid oxidase (DAO) family protein, partial [Bdellovibrio sp.]